jgi:hypothetical protein
MARKSTAENARFIDAKLTEAAEHARAAMKAYAAVIEAMEKGETEPQFKTPEIKDLLGTSRVLARSTVYAQMPWAGYATAREK